MVRKTIAGLVVMLALACSAGCNDEVRQTLVPIARRLLLFIFSPFRFLTCKIPYANLVSKKWPGRPLLNKENYMIIAYHAIFTTYGTWLPNDPRGSYSKAIYNDELRALGDIHYGRQAPQPNRQIVRRFRVTAMPRLSRPPAGSVLCPARHSPPEGLCLRN